MATDVTKLVLAVDSRQVSKGRKAADRLEKSGRGVEKSFKGAGSAMKVMAGVLTGAALAKVMGSVVSATIVQEKSISQLEATLRSTGRYTPELSQNMQDYAASLQQVTNYGDEAVIASQALMLTFTRIGNDEFPRAQKAVLDVATAMGTDLKSAAIQVGKALNDPVIGLTALSRSGITFTQDQKDLVKQLVETGNAAEAQRLILDELETQFGGSAEAARKTLGGALTSLGNAFGDLLEGDSGGEGVKGATEALEELTRLMSDPATENSAMVLVNTMISGFSKLTTAITTTVEFTQWLGDELASKMFGIAADDVIRLEMELERLQDRQEGAPRGLRLYQEKEIEKTKKLLAAAREMQDIARRSRKKGGASEPDVPVVGTGGTISSDDQDAIDKAKKSTDDLAASWGNVSQALSQEQELLGLDGLEKSFVEIEQKASELHAQFGPEYKDRIDSWSSAMKNMAQSEYDTALATERRVEAQKTAAAIADNNAAAADRVASAMDELTLAAMTGEEREVAMIERQYERLQNMARQLAMLGEISEEAADQMQAALGVQMSEALDELEKKGEGTAANLSDAFAGWANSHVKTLNDMLWSSEVTFDGILESFGKMVTEMLVKAAMLDMVGDDGKSGLIGDVISGLFSAASPAFNSTASASTGNYGPMPSAAGGYDIPSGVNPVTQLHEKEMVLPAKYADVIRDGGSGGTVINQTIQVDARGGEQDLEARLSQAVKEGAEKGYSMVLKDIRTRGPVYKGAKS